MISPKINNQENVLWHETGLEMVSRLDLMLLEPKRILVCGLSGSVVEKLSGIFSNAEIIQEEKNNEKVDIILANLVTPWIDDIKSSLLNWRSMLTMDGLLSFSSLGPDTLKQHHTKLLPRLIDMHDFGDILVEVGFKDPILDTSYLTLAYKDSLLLSQELIEMQMVQHNLDYDNKNLEITFEIVQGHAWRGEDKPIEAGIFKFPISGIKKASN